MKRISTLVFLVLVLPVLALGCMSETAMHYARQSAAENLTKEKTDALAEGNNRFACELYHQLGGQQGNLFFSPFSIQQAFGMVSAAAEGQALEEIREVMHFGLEDDSLHRAFAGMNINLDQYTEYGGSQFETANGLFTVKGYKAHRKLLNLLKTFYDAEFRGLDVSTAQSTEQSERQVNEWVEQKTNGFLKDPLGYGWLSGLSSYVFVNTAYFKAAWVDRFDEADEEDSGFSLDSGEQVQVGMMTHTGRYGICVFDDVKVLALPYEESTMEMILVLPNELDGLPEIERSLDSSKVEEWLDGITWKDVEVFMPRFSINQRFELSKVLKALGMHAPFSGGFSKMLGPDHYISKVIHSSRIEVDEEGTEAAAVTAVVMAQGIAMPGPEWDTFRADHPFLFLIRDGETGIILFMGRVTDPRQ